MFYPFFNRFPVGALVIKFNFLHSHKSDFATNNEHETIPLSPFSIFLLFVLGRMRWTWMKRIRRIRRRKEHKSNIHSLWSSQECSPDTYTDWYLIFYFLSPRLHTCNYIQHKKTYRHIFIIIQCIIAFLHIIITKLYNYIYL